MTKEQLEKEIGKLSIELAELSNRNTELSNKLIYEERIGRCFLYDEIFHFIKSYLQNGGEIVLHSQKVSSDEII